MGLLLQGQSSQGGKGDSRDTSTFVTSCPIGMPLPVDSCREGRVSLHFMQTGLSMPAAAGVVDEKGSEYFLAHTGLRELDGHPLGGCGSVWFSSQLYCPFGKGPANMCLQNKKCENERKRTSKHLITAHTCVRFGYSTR